MRPLRRSLLWTNLSALALNAGFLFLTIIHVCPAVVPIVLLGFCLTGLVLLSAKANGLHLVRARPPGRRYKSDC